MGHLLRRSIDVARVHSFWIWLLIGLNITFLFVGSSMVRAGIPWVIEQREVYLKEIQNLPYLKPLVGPLSPYLGLKILYTFLFNLIFGAFLSTTLPGVIFFLPILINIYRAWFVGVVFYGFTSSVAGGIIFLFTLFFEFGGYILSSVAGIILGMALLFPYRYGGSRKEAMRRAIRDGAYLYVLVVMFLLIGAIWEMTTLHYLSSGRGLKPGVF